MNTLTTATLTSLKFIYPNSYIVLFTIRHNGNSIEDVLDLIQSQATGYIEFNYSENVTYFLVITYNKDLLNSLSVLLENIPDISFSSKRVSQRDFQYLNHISEQCETYINIE